MKRHSPSRRDVLKGAGALALGTVFAAPARAAAPPAEAITSALIEAAKKEGTVVLYSSMDLPVGEKLGKAFEAAYPGIKIQIERSGSERLFQRLARHPLEEERLADAVRPGGRRQIFPGDLSRWRRHGRDLAHLSVVDRLQH